MADPAISGERICVVGSGMTGIECAEMLAAQGNHVELYEMLDEIGPDLFFQNRIDIMGRLGQTDARMFTDTRLTSVSDGSAAFERADGTTLTATFDHLVLSLDTESVPVPSWLRESGIAIAEAGDAASVGRIQEATRTGYDVAQTLLG